MIRTRESNATHGPAPGWLAASWRLVRQAWRRRRDRMTLLGMSEGLLDDLGLSRGDIDRELGRPFWEPVRWQELEAARRLRSGARGRHRL